MIPAPDTLAESLRDVAGEALIQETPYPVVAPRSVDALAALLKFARRENLHVLPLGSGSSFDSSFQLTRPNVMAVLTGGLCSIEKFSPWGFRVLSGTPVSRLFRGGIVHERKTLGGLIAGSAGIHGEVERTLWSQLSRIEVMNGEGELLQLAGPNRASAGDPGLASVLFGSQGRIGMIISADVRGPLPLDVALEEPRTVGAVLSPNAAVASRNELARILDPSSVFAW
jgi:FAD/FMN-containing dehydrogenase